MSISVRWQNSKKSQIYTHFDDPWTLDELIDARKSWYRMIKNVDGVVPIILDLRHTFEPPSGILRQFIAIHRTPHVRQGHILVCGLNPLYQKLSIHLFDGATDPEKLVIVFPSLEEILDFLREE